jgi:cystathionine beta-lyase
MITPKKFYSLEELQQRKSVKWRGYGEGVLPLPVMEMDFEIALPIRELLIEMISKSDTGYLGPVPEMGLNFAHFAKARWNWIVDPLQVSTCTDVAVGMIEMARDLFAENPASRRIMVNTPVYHNFSNWITELKAERVDAPLAQNGLHYTLDFEAIEREYAAGIAIHFLCNPHNPVGTVFTQDELVRLADLAEKYGVAIFSDEIHAPLTYKKEEFHPFLSVSDSARRVGICVTSPSKSWNLAGLKCAIIVTASEEQRARAAALPEAVHYRASLLGAFAGAQAYLCSDWLDDTLAQLDNNRHFLAQQLAEHLPTVGYRIPDSSYVGWLDLTSLDLGDDPAELLVTQAKVAFNPGATFSATHTQFIRFNFGTSPEIMALGVERIRSVVK